MSMSFIPGYKHDIFVSYAHVDDLPLGAEIGWVTNLVGCLKTRLAQMLGRSDAYSLWMDNEELRKRKKTTPQIIDALRETATIIIVLSPGYLASEWCQREKDNFLEFVKQRGGSRVFIVEREKVENHPQEFSDLGVFRFWGVRQDGKTRILGSPTPAGDQAFYDRIDDLAAELKEELCSLKREATQSPLELPLKTEQPTVFLAQPTDDLELERNNVKRYLNQAGVNVLPTTWYPQEPGAFREAVLRDLDKCQIFVQLLSGVAGRKPPDLPQGYTQLQIELAQQVGIPVLQWRRPTLALADIEDQAHRTLLDATTVRAEKIEDFKREIVKRVFEKPAPLPEEHLNAFVFVDMETPDRPLAEAVCNVLDEYGVDYSLPTQNDDPAEYRHDLEHNLSLCDGLIVVYGASTKSWVRRQLLECRKIMAMRKTPLNAFALYEGPPEEKEPLDLKIHNMKILNCRKGVNETEFRSFINGLRKEAG